MSDSTNKKKILILGGYGNTGKRLAPLLLKHTTADLVLAGRNLEKAKAFAQELQQREPPPLFVSSSSSPPNNRVTTAQVDAANKESLLEEFKKGISLVIVASSTSDYVDKVAEAALETKIDYFDLQFSQAKTEYLEAMKDEITNAGLCFITDGGMIPGLPAALIRHIAVSFDKLTKVKVGVVAQADWKASVESMSKETMEEFVSEFKNMKSFLYANSEWKEISLWGMMSPQEIDFGDPFGRRPCFPMFLDELRSIPEELPSVTDVGVYMGGINWFVDYFLFPIVILATMLFPQRAKQPMSRLLSWGLQMFSKPPYGTHIKVEASGVGKDGETLERTMKLFHQDEYALTAIPVAATVMQYLTSSSEKQSIRKPGLWRQGVCVDPHQLLLDMQVMGVDVEPRGSSRDKES